MNAASPHIALVGAGAIGARHLQSMTRLTQRADIAVVDPQPAARAKAIHLLGEAGRIDGTLFEHAGVAELRSAPDVAIVATDSRVRRMVIDELLELGCKNFLLEKVLFSRLDAYDAVEAALSAAKARAFVNCPRRSYPGARALRDAIAGSDIIYTVAGSEWGMGCNLIHHLDEFCWLTGQDDVSVSAAGLQSGTFPAKRSGYVEFFGRISGAAGRHRFMAQCSTAAGVKSGPDVTIDAGRDRAEISLRDRAIRWSGGKQAVSAYDVPLQSEMTAGQVESILAGKDPGLPTYGESARFHRAMISAFLAHMRSSSGNPDIDECPVT